MKNKGFEVKLNDEILSTAGIENGHSVVSCILTAMRRKEENQQEIVLDISGLNTDSKVYPKWVTSKKLNLNDTLSIKIVEGGFDEPISANTRVQKEISIEQKLKTFNRLKEELKDYL